MYKLHGFSQSGNTFKVAFLLRALQQPWEPVFVDFMNGVTRTEAWRAQSNAMGEVPVLEEDGHLMTQSALSSGAASTTPSASSTSTFHRASS
jgi:glutathione S-transferase